MFTVPFETAVSDSDIHRPTRVLGMSTHLHPQTHSSPASAGVARLDFFSGLFLRRSEGPGEWRLEGRTWDAPAPESVHDWHVVAATRHAWWIPAFRCCRGLRPLVLQGSRVRAPRRRAHRQSRPSRRSLSARGLLQHASADSPISVTRLFRPPQ
jgi:hypothetical protein